MLQNETIILSRRAQAAASKVGPEHHPEEDAKPNLSSRHTWGMYRATMTHFVCSQLSSNVLNGRMWSDVGGGGCEQRDFTQLYAHPTAMSPSDTIFRVHQRSHAIKVASSSEDIKVVAVSGSAFPVW